MLSVNHNQAAWYADFDHVAGIVPDKNGAQAGVSADRSSRIVLAAAGPDINNAARYRRAGAYADHWANHWRAMASVVVVDHVA